MKKKYEDLEIELIRFGAQDVITTSGDETWGDDSTSSGGNETGWPGSGTP